VSTRGPTCKAQSSEGGKIRKVKRGNQKKIKWQKKTSDPMTRRTEHKRKIRGGEKKGNKGKAGGRVRKEEKVPTKGLRVKRIRRKNRGGCQYQGGSIARRFWGRGEKARKRQKKELLGRKFSRLWKA